jgi:hypothetical protein
MTKRKQPITILDAIDDPKLFAPWFRKSTWMAWRTFLASLFALPMNAEQLALYQQCTGRTEAPTAPASEGWLVCGRRAGKSFILALCAVYVACFNDIRRHLAPGERATILVIATDRKQARVVLRFIRGMLTGIPMLKAMIEREAAESFDLNNSTTIEVATASFRSTRGYAIAAAICDELAFWQNDNYSAEPDYEIINAIRPGMLQFPNAMLLCASSPYARRGALWDAHKRHFGKDNDPILVWQAATRTMNSTVPQATIDEATERDPSSAAAEYGAEFRSDLEDFISREAVLACVDGVRERPPQIGKYRYMSFTDPSGGSNDSMVTAIGHREDDLIIVDCIREIAAPFDPESAATEFAHLFRSYGITTTHGDRYAAAWCSQAFEKRGIEYRHSELPKSGLYLNLLPHLNGKTIRLLDHPRSINQICSLERRTSRGGRDSIDHPPQTHDDICNAIAGLAFVANQPVQQQASTATYGAYGGDTTYTSTYGWSGDDNKPSPTRRRIEAEMAAQVPMCTIDFNNLPKIE